MPAASEAVGAPGGGDGGDVEQEYEIRNDEGFVYKVARGLYPDAAPSSSQPAAGPDPEAAGLRRRRRALLRLRDKRFRDLSRWEALASELLAPLPAPQPPASPPASSHPEAAAAASSSSHPVAAAAASSSASVLDDLLAQVEMQTDFLKKARQWCDEANALCDAREAAIFDSIVPPLWGGNPKELMVGLCSPEENTASGNLDEQNGPQEASGVSSAAAKMRKNSIKKQKVGHDLLPPILSESRKRKRVTNLLGSNNVASQSSVEPKRKKASGSTSTARGTPGSASRRKAESTPARAPDIVCSPGPLTRRRAAAKNESPGGS
ncbi:uncharacterized protein [Miscanthus floridulus]|uniref:uncharacterized protein n=1 Tax=Miscanthus floridulus TaxID=154761 RepID=UPI003458F20C